MTNPNSDHLWRDIRFRDAANIPADAPSSDRTPFRVVCWIVIAISVPLALVCLIALAA